MNDQVPPATPEPPASQQPMLPTFPSYPTAGIQWYDRNELPPSKTKAAWALALACLPVPITWLLSLILAIQVLGDSKHGRDHGRHMAISALFIIPAWIVVGILTYALQSANDADRDASGAVTRSGEVLVTDVRAGDCLDEDFTDEAMYTVDVVPCTEPHAIEAYAGFDLEAGDFPGDEEVERLATSDASSASRPSSASRRRSRASRSASSGPRGEPGRRAARSRAWWETRTRPPRARSRTPSAE